jgi:hypothetical protein
MGQVFAFVSKKFLSCFAGNVPYEYRRTATGPLGSQLAHALCKLSGLQKLNLSRTVCAIFHGIEGDAAWHGAMRGVCVCVSELPRRERHQRRVNRAACVAAGQSEGTAGAGSFMYGLSCFGRDSGWCCVGWGDARCLCLFLSRLEGNVIFDDEVDFQDNLFTEPMLVLGQLTALQELNLEGMA